MAVSGTEKKNKTVNITAPIIRSLACSLVMLIFTACSGEAPAIPDGQDAAAIQSGGAGRTEEGKETGESVESADMAESEEDADTSSGDVPEMEVHFIDVGQADATLIKIDGHAMLIDCGTDEVGTLAAVTSSVIGIGGLVADPSQQTIDAWTAQINATITALQNGAVRYDSSQSLTTAQKLQARTNIGAATTSALVIGQDYKIIVP